MTQATNLTIERPIARSAGRASARWQRFKSRATPYVFIAPNMVLFSVFIFFPLLYAFYISFHEW